MASLNIAFMCPSYCQKYHVLNYGLSTHMEQLIPFNSLLLLKLLLEEVVALERQQDDFLERQMLEVPRPWEQTGGRKAKLLVDVLHASPVHQAALP